MCFRGRSVCWNPRSLVVLSVVCRVLLRLLEEDGADKQSVADHVLALERCDEPDSTRGFGGQPWDEGKGCDQKVDAHN